MRRALPDRSQQTHANQSSAIWQAFLGAHHLQSGDHVPVAASRIVGELSDCVAGRYALDAPLFGRNAFVARYDERFGVHGHCTPEGALMLPQNMCKIANLGCRIRNSPRARAWQVRTYCPLPVHDWQERERHSGTGKTIKKAAEYRYAPHQYWGF
jgi:hypothetical protein